MFESTLENLIQVKRVTNLPVILYMYSCIRVLLLVLKNINVYLKLSFHEFHTYQCACMYYQNMNHILLQEYHAEQMVQSVQWAVLYKSTFCVVLSLYIASAMQKFLLSSTPPTIVSTWNTWSSALASQVVNSFSPLVVNESLTLVLGFSDLITFQHQI